MTIKKDYIDVIKEMEKCKRVHHKWALYQEKRKRCGLKPLPHVGNAYRHRKFMKIYDEVLRHLRKRLR
jgi:hypothetical protein